MKTSSYKKRFACVVCVCLLAAASSGLGLAMDADVQDEGAEGATYAAMEILYDEGHLEFIPEIPQAEYSAAVRIDFSDTSYDIPAPWDVQWSSDNEDVFWVNSNGGIHPTGVGTANITAEYGGHSMTQAITIRPGTIISILPETEVIAAPPSRNAYPNVKIFALASNGVRFTLDEQTSVRWSSGNPQVARDTDAGVLLSDFGSTTLTATAFGKTTQVKAVVLEPGMVSLAASKTQIELSPDYACDLMITATFGADSFDVTDLAEWSVTDENVVLASGGYVIAAGLGGATINVSFGGQTIAVPVSVVPPAPNYDPPPFS